ncbi:MAG: aldehyde ferredoxin oxidoreductase C-terminal domain-containing protein, partial [Methanomicrobiales archaeon]|nr:aldehyde ferredoxin oxidoreductase C-terminal domain-containing protein [Methanomicrobiales archaeon]
RREPLLSEYYRARGWDAEGRPTKEQLASLGIPEDAVRGVPGEGFLGAPLGRSPRGPGGRVPRDS